MRLFRLGSWFCRFAPVVIAIAVPSMARAQVCMTLSYSFQPDCYRPDAGSACVQTIDRLDLGPQIAVWVQSADGSQFVDTLMVTNLTAVRGIGNRPGRWDFLSAPLFPYGKRQMALPIWAHARGVLYDTVIMTEAICAVGGPNFPAESCLGWHEPYSSPESYYCRPLKPGEINVDAISCASAFHSEKGKLDPTTKSYYPPRGDLTTFTTSDGSDPPTYAAINDLDAVAAATPAYGAPYTGHWTVPVELAAGDYVVMVEVNKEFDSNAANMHPDYDDPNLPGYGIDGNFGQPSVVYSVPIHIDLTNGTPRRPRCRRLPATATGAARPAPSPRRTALSRRPIWDRARSGCCCRATNRVCRGVSTSAWGRALVAIRSPPCPAQSPVWPPPTVVSPPLPRR